MRKARKQATPARKKQAAPGPGRSESRCGATAASCAVRAYSSWAAQGLQRWVERPTRAVAERQEASKRQVNLSVELFKALQVDLDMLNKPSGEGDLGA